MSVTPSWKFKRVIVVSNAGLVATDHQIEVVIDTASLVSAGKMNSSGNDVRFTDGDDFTDLNYFIREGTMNTSATVFHIKIPSIPNGGKHIYMYYGNSGASAVQSGDNTYDLYDAFEGTVLNTGKWDTGGVVNVSGGYVEVREGDEREWSWCKSKTAFYENMIMEAVISIPEGIGSQDGVAFGFWDRDRPNHTSYGNASAGNQFRRVAFSDQTSWTIWVSQANGASRQEAIAGIPQGSGNYPRYLGYIRVDHRSTQGSYFYCEGWQGSFSSAYLPEGYPLNVYFGAGQDDNDSPDAKIRCYWVSVRKYNPNVSAVAQGEIPNTAGGLLHVLLNYF